MIKTTYKLIAGIALLAISFTSCQEKGPDKQEIVQKNLEKYIKPKLHDPTSYNFTKLILTDSVTYNDNVQYHKDYYRRNLKADISKLQRQQKFKNENSSMYVPERVDELNIEIEKHKKILSEIDRLAKQMGNAVNNIASYTFNYSFNSTNTNGAEGSYKYIVQTGSSPDFKILKLAEDTNQLLLTPNDFPGFRKMVDSYN